MSHLRLVPRNDHLIREAYLDFILSRKVAQLAPKTIDFYEYTAGAFVEWLSLTDPADITTRHVRAFLAETAEQDVKDSTLHAFARGVRAFLNFCSAEGYIPEPIKVQMPRVANKRLPVLNAEDVRRVIDACRKPRDRALVLVMVDTGLRRSEVAGLTWGDVDLSTGVIRVIQGKGRRDRTVVVGLRTRRSLLKLRRSVPHELNDSVFGLKPAGVRQALRRLGDRTGLHLSPHVLRRTFATLALRGGMSPLHLQRLLGHTSLEMTRRYIQLVDQDLVDEHERSGPVDRWL